jgi:hypothetical protein
MEFKAVQVAHDAMKHLKLENWFKTYEPKESYALDNHPNTWRMVAELEKRGQGHSGASFAWVMAAVRQRVQRKVDVDPPRKPNFADCLSLLLSSTCNDRRRDECEEELRVRHDGPNTSAFLSEFMTRE